MKQKHILKTTAMAVATAVKTIYRITFPLLTIHNTGALVSNIMQYDTITPPMEVPIFVNSSAYFRHLCHPYHPEANQIHDATIADQLIANRLHFHFRTMNV